MEERQLQLNNSNFLQCSRLMEKFIFNDSMQCILTTSLNIERRNRYCSSKKYLLYDSELDFLNFALFK